MDRFSHLPNDVLHEALGFLSFTDTIKCSSFCKSMFNLLFKQPHLLFRYYLDKEFPSYPPFKGLSNMECLKKLLSFHRQCFGWDCLTFCESVSARYLHRSVVTNDGDLIFFGGAGNSHFNDTWKMSLNDSMNNVIFQKFDSTSEPSSRGSCAMCMFGKNVFCFGGRDSHGTFLNSLLCLSTDSGVWTEVHPCVGASRAGESRWYPPKRWGHTIIEWNGLMILFGGGEYGQTYNDLWVLDLTSLQLDNTSGEWTMHHGWKRINTYILDADAEARRQPLGRSGHACLVMQEYYMYIMGGNNLLQTFDDMWRIDLRLVAEAYHRDTMAVNEVPWELIPSEQGDERPDPQIGHVAVPLGTRRFLMFGGRNVHGNKMISGFMTYDTVENRWQRFNDVRNQELLMNRTGHCALPHANGVLFFGGLCEDGQYTAEVVSLDIFSSGCLPSFTSQDELNNDTSVFSLSNIINSLSISFFSFHSNSNSNSNSDSSSSIMSPRMQITRGPDIPHDGA
mmetsp:Transcript_9414/g.17615  ORF Transcript_9414/g.17615 Transcript_9414/m.17615 type:complete len:506 (+) Transcript_9414:52-1569(+)